MVRRVSNHSPNPIYLYDLIFTSFYARFLFLLGEMPIKLWQHLLLFLIALWSISSVARSGGLQIKWLKNRFIYLMTKDLPSYLFVVSELSIDEVKVAKLNTESNFIRCSRNDQNQLNSFFSQYLFLKFIRNNFESP